ncbi:BlaR1 peptidase M56 [Chitinophaga skermanii]|uniref:BlaR1 peptidase M56 n=1 Tax=Chitinophaga skermanii TaxID=331697 RepID=A0A327Q959_9BACT|nr:M56 family metallopeptidase [Chitinophaga skermanii]RAJ00348.1 BlaR1 peptidase M56 [Chitinophaga skermanii]
MNHIIPFTSEIVRAFGWTLIHSLWQAFFVYACLKIVLRIWPMASARIKYSLSYLSLTGIFAWFAITLYQQLSAVPSLHLASQAINIDLSTLSTENFQPVVHKVQASSNLQYLLPGLNDYLPILVAFYIVGVVVIGIRLVIDLSQLRSMRKKYTEPVDAVWQTYTTRLAAKLNIRKYVRVVVSDTLQVPCMMGWLKPLIIMPSAMLMNLSPEQLEAILLHELAHIKRNDYLLNIFQSIVETILFFNPFVRWISSNIRVEREHCCDDMVINATVQPLHYAKALVALEEYRLTANPMAMAAARNKQHLFHRIKRIMEMKTIHLNYTQRFLALMIVATGLISIAWLNPANKAKAAERKLSTDLADTTKPSVTVIKNKNLVIKDEKGKVTEVVQFKDLPVEEQKKVEEALKKIPSEAELKKVTEEAIKAAKDVDWVNLEGQLADLKKLNVEDFKFDIKMALAGIDNLKDLKALSPAELEKLKSSLNALDLKFVNEDLKLAQNIDLKDLQLTIEKSLKDIDVKNMNINFTFNDTFPDAIKEQTRAAVEQARKQAEVARAGAEIARKEAEKARIAADINRQNSEIARKQADVARAGAEVARKEAEKARINAEAQRATIEEARKAADVARAQADANRQAAAKVRESAEIARAQADQARAGAEVARKQAEVARAGAEVARKEAEKTRELYRKIVAELEADNLVDTKKGFTFKKKNGEIFIDGVKQNATITEKYNKLVPGENITFTKNTSAENIHTND